MGGYRVGEGASTIRFAIRTCHWAGDPRLPDWPRRRGRTHHAHLAPALHVKPSSTLPHHHNLHPLYHLIPSTSIFTSTALDSGHSPSHHIPPAASLQCPRYPPRRSLEPTTAPIPAYITKLAPNTTKQLLAYPFTSQWSPLAAQCSSTGPRTRTSRSRSLEMADTEQPRIYLYKTSDWALGSLAWCLADTIGFERTFGDA
ncbi:hypothetical protein BDV95DRAFT_397230 [Massariosphaeria phaeospora]|uniref:Uncharacterized protein n=1 Tax=Massariosphaeria phaeospora TaxID=100035 RepID=A0A7C8MMF5_9PLEO|nr:hypothetical protein BDV95DRAFT_397230 [Massariosphaeria phaeospora]